ncbi:MAG: hypothetical protein LBJ41_11455 [Treponema sp.]|jgi:uncharacterized protein (UPF0305 family)|nr:hypothetical protein [Treponema sp.]
MDNDGTTVDTKEEFGGIQKSDLLALLKYLFELTEYLPPKQKEEFLNSTIHEEINHLIDTLEN